MQYRQDKIQFKYKAKLLRVKYFQFFIILSDIISHTKWQDINVKSV